ncbi:probable RNA polymerase II nuclear localization protein SLC7A6OS [Zerene cesonia]|uniref:probable RNA polymerase II nuclear localization protein SLC7A6OS n=1 Tax=Zerene cesonia TaxID=33412 RepID=UPI0018E58687|nr:probable RNA polymerase II nuclear localization protein SLC7A6OS [Zerene cesonia]
MASSTVLRVKRRLQDNPQDALVLVCKRRKTDTEEISPSLFVFRGTVDNQETSQLKTIVPKTEIKLKPKTDVDDIIKKIRQERKDTATENRYAIVNFNRGVKDDDDINLVDLEATGLDGDGAKFTYDLYTAIKEDFDISMLDNLVSIENYETDLILGTYRDNGSSDEADDDDDSNDENNWRNDYPDTEPSSIDEDDMIAAMERCDIDDLSSDDGEDKIYNDPPDLFNEDVKRYGAAYAKYKARVIAEETEVLDSKNLVHCSRIKDLDEESIDGYKDDSDNGFYYGQDEETEQFCEQYSDDVYNPD